MKKCRDCAETKSITDFYFSASCLDRLRPECKDCYNKARKIKYLANKAKITEGAKLRRRANPEKYKKKSAEYYAKNADKVKIRTAKYQRLNPTMVAKCGKKYRSNNKGKVASNDRKRKLSKLQRTPSWLTPEQLKEIEQFYIDAAELSWLSNGGLEVDHIIPLRGKTISGLHVPQNLQILPKALNRQKGNKFDLK